MSLAMWKLTMITENMDKEKSETETEKPVTSQFDQKLKEQIEGLIVKAKAIQCL